MKDNLSIVITVIVLVLLMVIFPLYNFFERQDNMSYNLVLKATTNFADQVMNNGYIDQNTYDKFVTELGNTGNVYDIEIEAHRRVLTQANDGSDVYEEQSYIDYNDDIFNAIESNTSSNLMEKKLKNNIYFFNPKDEIYVKVKNSNTTMAGALFNAIIPSSSKTRIAIDYGGIIKNNAWKGIDATFTGHNIAPGAPVLYLSLNTTKEEIKNEDGIDYYEISNSDYEGKDIIAVAEAFEGRTISKYFWTFIDEYDNSEQKKETFTQNFNDVTLTEGHKYIIEVYAVDNAGYRSESTKVKISRVKTKSNLVPTDITADINNDGVVNDDDYNLLNNYLNNGGTLTDNEKKKADINNDNVIDKRDLEYFKEIEEKGYILGDVNGDNNISIADRILIQNYLANTIELTANQLKKADMNGDGNISIADFILLDKKLI